MINTEPKQFKPFIAKQNQSDSYKYFLDYQKNPAYKDETMQKIITSIDGLREHLAEKKEIIFYNNDRWHAVNWSLKNERFDEHKTKLLRLKAEQFDKSYRGDENSAYRITFDSLVKNIWKN